MKNTLSALVIAGLTLAVAAPTQAQVTKQGTSYLFRIGFKKGMVIKYNIAVETLNATTKNGGFKMNLPASMIVKDFSKGIATIESSVNPPSANAKPEIKVFKVNTKGELVSGSVPVQGQGMFINFPQNAIAPGFAWSSKTSQSGVNADIRYKFTGVKAVAGKQMAIISVVLSGKGSQTISGTGQMLIQLNDGMLFKMNTDMTAATGGKPLKMRMTMSKSN